MTVLSTERLTLRPFELRDAAPFYRLYQEAGVWSYFSGRPPASPKEERANILRHQEYYRRNGFGFCATVFRQTGELIGRCGLLAQVVDGRAETEIAYLLSPRYWGRGLASEAARAVRDHAFRSLGCSRLLALIHPDNLASKRVAIAVGLRYDRNTWFHEKWIEVYRMERGDPVA